ncbi:MAG: DUF501 domain-containing protein [Firmicutes bacterium]|nr:DUF501 domain-containing protein [Bacillota bacterium]
MLSDILVLEQEAVEVLSVTGKRRGKEVDPRDIDLIEAQLGRRPKGVAEIVTRCPSGAPQVIKNIPVTFDEEDPQSPPRILPTLYWLTCPELLTAVARLEAEGMVSKLQEIIDKDPRLTERLQTAHARHARQRRELVTDTAWASRWPQQFTVISQTGVGGIRGSGIKCLHTHYADFLATGDNPVGELVHKELKLRGWLPCQEAGLGGSIPCFTQAKDEIQPDTEVEAGKLLAAGKVGTNSCRIVVTQGEPSRSQDLTVVADWSVESRIGAGVDETKSLSPEAVDRTIAALKQLLAQTEIWGAALVDLAGTGALREAANAEEFVDRVKAEVGVDLRIISGSEEARLSYAGATAKLPEEQRKEATVIDIGGGSTEIMGQQGELVLSLEVGAVRLTERWLGEGNGAYGDSSQWEELLTFATRAVEAALATQGQKLVPSSQVVGVGGTFTTLAAIRGEVRDYHRAKVEGMGLALEEFDQIGRRLFALPPEKRVNIPGLPPARADIITEGVAIALAVLQQLGADGVMVSTNDMLLGMILQAGKVKA